MAARVAEGRAEASAASRDLCAKYEEDIRVKLAELEERKQNEFAMAMLNVRQGIKKLEAQLHEARLDFLTVNSKWPWRSLYSYDGQAQDQRL